MGELITGAEVDFVTNGIPNGSMAQRLLANGMDVNVMRTNTTLRKDEWMHYDTAIIEAVQDRLTGVEDLIRMGLTYNVGNGMGKTVLEYEDVSDMNAASMDMDGRVMGEFDRVKFGINYLPLPIIHKEFKVNARTLAASRSTGQSLDVTQAQLSARKVGELLETTLFTGASSFAFGGGTIYGYLDHPDINTVSIGTNWDDSAASGAGILENVTDAKQALISAGFYGPYSLYIPTNFDVVLDKDYVSGYPKTIRQRILEIEGINSVKVADKLTDDNVVLVQMTSDVVRLVQGLPVTTVEWTSLDMSSFFFKVMTIQIPQIRSDQSGNSGVCVIT